MPCGIGLTCEFNTGPITESKMHRSEFQMEILNIPFHLKITLIGWTLRKFTQLKRNKRFENFIMLVWVQGSLFYIAAGSHPVQEAWGSQDSL